MNRRPVVLAALALAMTFGMVSRVRADPYPWASDHHRDDEGDDDDGRSRGGDLGGYDPCGAIIDRIEHDRGLIAQWEDTGRHQKVVRWAQEDVAKAERDLSQCRSQAPDPIGDDDDLGSESTAGYFRNDLAPYGEWLQIPTYGWAWRPSDVDSDWQPYTRGRWLDTDYGWTWVADEPWGWAPHHYGRWFNDARYGGWVWVPGRRWAPAWVDWRRNDEYVGWAPLPPTAVWQPGVGISPRTVTIEPHDYCFVETRHIVEPKISRFITPFARNATIIQNTARVTNYRIVNNRVANHSIPDATVERAIGHQVPRYPIHEVKEAAPRVFAPVPTGNASTPRLANDGVAKLPTHQLGVRNSQAAKTQDHGAETVEDGPSEVERERTLLKGQQRVERTGMERERADKERQENAARERQEAEVLERNRIDREREDAARRDAQRHQEEERRREEALAREAASNEKARMQREAALRHQEAEQHDLEMRRKEEGAQQLRAAHQEALRREEAERVRAAQERKAQEESQRRQAEPQRRPTPSRAAAG